MFVCSVVGRRCNSAARHLFIPPPRAERSSGEGRPERSEGRGGGVSSHRARSNAPHPSHRSLSLAISHPPHRSQELAGGGIRAQPPFAISAPSSPRTRAITSAQLRLAVWRNRRMVGYHGLSSRSSRQR